METSVVVQNEGLANKFNLKSEAVTVIVGETLAALEAQKQQLMDQLPLAQKAHGAACTQVSEATNAQVEAEKEKALKWPIAAQFRKAMAAANRVDGLTLVAVTLAEPEGFEVTVHLQRKSDAGNRYNDSVAVARTTVPYNAQVRAAVAARDASAEELLKLTREITKLEVEINRLPHTKMLIEASVAKQSLLSTEAGREVYAAAQESLQAMAGKDLKTMLALGPMRDM